MKKIFLLASILATTSFFQSCKNESTESKDSNNNNSIALINEDGINSIFNTLKEEGDLDEKTFKKLQAKVKEYNDDLKEKSIKQNQAGDTSIVKVNSLELFKNIYQDRSLNLQQYYGKDIIITDILLDNVKTIDRDNEYFKYAYGIPFDPKSNTIAMAKKDDWYESENQLNLIAYKGNFLNYDEVSDLAKNEASIEIKLNAPDEMKKINLLSWECNDSLNYSHKIDIKCRIVNVDYDKGADKKDDIKAKKIKITVENGEIYTGK